MVKAKVLDVDIEKERISLGIKQLGTDAFAAPKAVAGEEAVATGADVKKGSVVTCEVLEVKEGGLEVRISGTDFQAFVKRNELARDRADPVSYTHLPQKSPQISRPRPGQPRRA